MATKSTQRTAAGTRTIGDELVRLQAATLQRGGQALWKKLDIAVNGGEFVAVLGPNGAGKTSLLKVLLGLLPLTQGSVRVAGVEPHRGNPQVGYIPQQKSFDAFLPITGRDLVQLGVNGHTFGLFGGGQGRTRVDEAIRAVGANKYADKPVGLLSGGEQQRLRIAQALVSRPKLLLCDEPLLSLDLASQQNITQLIHTYRNESGAAVLFVTHEINPILPAVDKVLYLANGRWILDTPEQVLRAETLSELYGTQVEVVRVGGRVIVVGAEGMGLDETAHHEEHGA